MLKPWGDTSEAPSRGRWLIIIVKEALHILNGSAVNALLNVLVAYSSVTYCDSKVLDRFPLVLTLVGHLLDGNDDCTHDSGKPT